MKFLSWRVYFSKASCGYGKTKQEAIGEAGDQEVSKETVASAQGRENQSLTKRLEVEFIHFLGLFKFYRKEDEIQTQVPS